MKIHIDFRPCLSKILDTVHMLQWSDRVDNSVEADAQSPTQITYVAPWGGPTGELPPPEEDELVDGDAELGYINGGPTGLGRGDGEP